MVGRFAGRGGAVVATYASTRNLAVVKTGVLPVARGVAIIAVVAALYVRRCFSRGHAAVVAGETGARRIAVIKPGYRHPRVRCMTGLAVVSGRHVVWRFALSTQPRGRCVTRCTACWRALEDAPGVAGVTIGILVGPGERKSGGEVVEVAVVAA